MAELELKSLATKDRSPPESPIHVSPTSLRNRLWLTDNNVHESLYANDSNEEEDDPDTRTDADRMASQAELASAAPGSKLPVDPMSVKIFRLSTLVVLLRWLFGKATANKCSRIRADNAERLALNRMHKDKSFMELVYSVFDLRLLWSKIQRIIKNPFRVAVFTILDLCCDLIFSLLYLVEIQVSEPVDGGRWLLINRPDSIWIIAVVLSFFNLSSTLFRLVFAKNRNAWNFGWLFLLDLLTSIQFIIMLGLPEPYHTQLYVPYFLRIWLVQRRIQRVLELQAEYKLFNQTFDPLAEKLFILALTIFTIIYTGACAFQYTEIMAIDERFSFYDSFYFIVITMSTVGYGDISPRSAPGKIVVVVVILVALIVLPQLIGDVVDTLLQRRERGGELSRSAKKDFVVVLTSLMNEEAVIYIADQILHSEVSQKNHLVFFAPRNPSPELQNFFNRSALRERVTFIRGQVSEDDLERAKLAKANAVFVIADRVKSSQHHEEDQGIVLKTWTADLVAPKTPIFVSYLHPEIFRLLELNVTASVCIGLMTQMLMAYNTLYPGTATFMTNLIIQKDPSGLYPPWLEQYADGLGNELYPCRMNPVFIGKTFVDVVAYLFQEFQAILIGVNIYIPDKKEAVVVLNPGRSYVLKKEDELILICHSKREAEMITELTQDQFDDTFQESAPAEQPDNQTLLRRSTTQLKSLLVEKVPSRFALIGEDSGRGCYVRSQSATLEGARLNTTDELTDGAFIVIFTENYDMFGSLVTLRSEQLSRQEVRPIVLFSIRPPTEQEWEWISKFFEIYYIVGDVHNVNDLLRAGIRRAHSIVILGLESLSTDEFLPDAASIMTYRLIHFLLGTKSSIRVSIELKSRNAIKFTVGYRRMQLEELPDDREYFMFAPAYCAGLAFVPAVLDACVVQTYHKRSILPVIKALCGIWDAKPAAMLKEFLGHESMARLKTIPIPPGFSGRTFKELFRYLIIEEGVLAVGLYREGLGFACPAFVYTNPLAQAYLFNTDSVFVISAN